MNFHRIKKSVAILCSLFVSLVFHGLIQASPHGGGPTTITGVVYKQGLVFDEVNGSNQPRYVEFDADTGDVKVWIDDPLIDASDRTLWIGNGTDYRSAAAAYNNFINLMSSDDFAKLTVVSKNEFNNSSFNADYPAEFLEFKGTPYTESRSLLVYKPEALNETVQLDDQNGLIVYESRYDLGKLRSGEALAEKSLILDDEGKILHKSFDNIGFRVAFVTPDGEMAEERSASYKPGDELVAPITYGTVSTGLNPVTNFAIGEDGRYQAYNIMPPCPGMTVDFLVPVTAAIPYRTYNPQRKGSFNQYFFSSYSNYFCAGAPFHPPGFTLGGATAYIDSLSIYTLLNDQPPQAHFKIDVTLLSGQFKLSNGRYEAGYDEKESCEVEFSDAYGDESCFSEIPVGDTTTYGFETEHSKLYKLPEAPDFNFDGEDDYVALLDENADEQSPSSYGVWFNLGDDLPASGLPLDEDDELIEPDLVRYTKQDQNFEDLGLLTQISEEDLANTDVFVFRESTGELVVEKTPFTENRKNASTGLSNGVSREINGGFFELTVPGSDGYQSAQYFGKAKGLYEDWQADMDLEEAFRGDVDSLRAGEPIRVVAINRATGYVGSVRTNLTQSEELSFNDSMLGISIPKLILYPPNLKVEVTRKYEVEYGLTQGEERKYGVGFEGAALHGDQYLSIHTEWLDYDGTQLPSALPGLTGRLSSIVSENMLSPDSKVDHFDIKPGKHIEVLELNNGTAGEGASHQYVHVVGENIDDDVDFGTTGSGELQYRPAKPVPLKVAVYDEEQSRNLKEAQLSQTDDSTEQDSSVYEWVYRPEMMYSVHEHEISSITREFEGETIDLLEAKIPSITGDDDALNLNQTITQSEYDPLDFFGPEQSLVFSLDEYQNQLPRISQGKPVSFTSFGHIGNVGAVEFLSMNLLNQSDAGNILWEFAFETLVVDTTLVDEDLFDSDGTLVISADAVPINIHALRLGNDNDVGDQVLNWDVIKGQANVVEGPRQSDGGVGVWPSVLEIEPLAGNEVQVRASLVEDTTVSTTMRTIFVTPGIAKSVDIDITGQPYMLGYGHAEVTILIKDNFGNVVADGTPVGLTISGGGVLESEEVSTVNGVARAVIRGGFESAVGAEFVVAVADIEEARTIDILPLELTLEGLETQHERGETSTLIATVTADGSPAKDVAVDMVATHGLVKEFTSKTNELGQVQVPLLHLRPGANATVAASLGLDVTQTLTYDLVYKDDGERRIESVETLVLGDQQVDGSLEHERYDGAMLAYAYAAQSPFSIQGDANESAEIKLGDLADPNLAPMAMWNMSELELIEPDPVYHNAELSPGSVETIEAESSQFAPQNSFQLSLTVTEERDENAAEEEQQTFLLDMAGAYRLIREPDGLASLEVRTADGTHILKSNVVLTGTHEISVHLIEGLLSFSVDDDRVEKELRNSPLQYSENTNYTLRAPVNHRLFVDSLVFEVPAIRPILNGFTLDETTLHIAETRDVSVVSDHPMQIGNSYEVNASGSLTVEPAEQLKPAEGLGFRVDIKRLLVDGEVMDSPVEQTLVNMAGAMQLSMTDEGRVKLTVNTSNGTETIVSSTDYTVPTGPVDPGVVGDGTLSSSRWHTIAVKYHENQISLSVDGIVDSSSASGDLVYATSTNAEDTERPDLVTLFAPASVIRYNSFKIYDWNSNPLLKLRDPQDSGDDQGNGANSLVVTLDDDGRSTLDIVSLGNLNNQQSGSEIPFLRVAVVSGEARDTVSLVSTEYYKDISGVILETLAEGQPPIQEETTGSLSNDMMIGTVDFFFPPAHADIGSFFLGAVSFIIPFESVGILAQQLYYLAKNDDRFDRVELIVSALGTLSIIPVAKPLKPLLPGIRSFLKAGRNLKPEFYKSVAGPMGHAIKEAAFGRTALVRDWLTVLVIISEMITDTEARETLVFLLNTVQSEDDLNAVVQWLSLPTDGWTGEGLVRAEIGDISDDSEGRSLVDDVAGFFIKDADAAGVRTLVSVASIVKAIKPLTGQDQKIVIRGIKAVVAALRITNNSLRGIAHSPQLLPVASRLMANGLKALVKNTRNLRIGPVMAVSILSYVQSRETCAVDPFSSLVQCKAFPNLVTMRNLGKWDSFIERINTAKRVTGNMNGALFHLLVLATYQLEYEFGIVPHRPVAQEYTIPLTVKDAKSKSTPKQITLERNVDIVVENVSDGAAANPSFTPSPKALWIEVKSLGRSSLGAPQWTVASGRTSRHRQFALDCSGWKNFAVSENGGFRWWLQTWKPRNGSKVLPPKQDPHMNTLNTNLHKFPNNGDPADYGAISSTSKICATQKAKLFDFKNVLTDTLLTGISPKIVAEVRANLPVVSGSSP